MSGVNIFHINTLAEQLKLHLLLFFSHTPSFTFTWNHHPQNKSLEVRGNGALYHGLVLVLQVRCGAIPSMSSQCYCWWFRNPPNQLRLVVYPIVYGVLYIPGGCLGFLPSTVTVIQSWLFRLADVMIQCCLQSFMPSQENMKLIHTHRHVSSNCIYHSSSIVSLDI